MNRDILGLALSEIQSNAFFVFQLLFNHSITTRWGRID